MHRKMCQDLPAERLCTGTTDLGLPGFTKVRGVPFQI